MSTLTTPIARERASYPRGGSLWIGCPSTDTILALPCLLLLLELQDIAFALLRDKRVSSYTRLRRFLP